MENINSETLDTALGPFWSGELFALIEATAHTKHPEQYPKTDAETELPYGPFEELAASHGLTVPPRIFTTPERLPSNFGGRCLGTYTFGYHVIQLWLPKKNPEKYRISRAKTLAHEMKHALDFQYTTSFQELGQSILATALAVMCCLMLLIAALCLPGFLQLAAILPLLKYKRIKYFIDPWEIRARWYAHQHWLEYYEILYDLEQKS